MVKVLIRRKVFQKQRYRGQWYCVAIDASGGEEYFFNAFYLNPASPYFDSH
jgi:hypothetical protein